MEKNRNSPKNRLTKDKEKLVKELQSTVLGSSKKKKGELKSSVIPLIIIILLGILLYVYFEKIRKDEASVAEGLLYVDFIDVGQGDSTLIRSGDSAMLIDSGEAGETKKVIAHLESLGITHLDKIAATHPHSDHMGGLYKIIDSFDVDEVIIPHIDDSDIPTSRYFEKFLDSCEAHDVAITEASVGEIIEIGEARAEIIAPQEEKYSDINNYSIGIYLTHGKNSFLMTGDAEDISEAQMLESGMVRHADVYKAGHHGSRYSSTDEFLAEVTPEYVVISCGKGNSYGHPHKEALKRIKEYTSEIYRTDKCGNIIFKSDGNELSVSTER